MSDEHEHYRSDEGSQTTNRLEYLKLAGVFVVVIFGFAGWFIQWQVTVSSTFMQHRTEIDSLKSAQEQDRRMAVQGRAEILSELRYLRDDIRRLHPVEPNGMCFPSEGSQ